MAQIIVYIDASAPNPMVRLKTTTDVVSGNEKKTAARIVQTLASSEYFPKVSSVKSAK